MVSNVNQNNSFLKWAETVQGIFELRGNNDKIQVCSNYLKTLKGKDLELAVQFLGEGSFSKLTGKRASVGHRTISLIAAEFCEIDYELVFKPSRTATGSSSETIFRLFENVPEAQSKIFPEELSLHQIQEIFERLYEARKREDKSRILQECFSKFSPLETKYFLRILGNGSLRIGFETRSLVSALSKAFGYTLDEVRFTHMLTGSISETAQLASQNKLETASFNLFQPIDFMLASPYSAESIDTIEDYVAEEKFDGMRCQLHVEGGDVKLFSRDLNDISDSFPEIIESFKAKSLPSAVFDGEICVFKDNMIMPFQHLQKRMGVKKPSKKILSDFPTVLICYDLLYYDEKLIFQEKLSQRRERLIAVSKEFEIAISNQFSIKSKHEVEELFEKALNHGNEGLMLKNIHSTYDYGQRKKSWLKVKKPNGSIDTVILYAHAGSGKRGGTYSDFTLGISVKEDDRFEEEFIPIGKAYGGYTNDELSIINKKISEITLERFGPTLLLKPEIIVELEFDEIQVNKRTKAKYTLRFPRFKSIRWDLKTSDVDTLKDVEFLFQKNVHRIREKQQETPSFILPSNN